MIRSMMKIDWEKHLQIGGMTLEQFVFSLSLIDYTHDEIGKMVGKSPEWVSDAISEAVRRHEKLSGDKSVGDE
jgi:hypothetical protein